MNVLSKTAHMKFKCCTVCFLWSNHSSIADLYQDLNSRLERKKEGLTSVSPSRDDVGDALSTQKEANYASHAESPNRDPEESHTRCRVKIQNTDRGRDGSKGGKGES